MLHFFQMLLGYTFPELVKNATKIQNGGEVNLLLTQKDKKISLNCIFLYLRPYVFDAHDLAFYYQNLLHKKS